MTPTSRIIVCGDGSRISLLCTVGGNSISNLTFATNLPHLTHLSLFNIGEADFAPLAALPGLRSLGIAYTCLTNWSSLTNVNQLTSVQINDTCLDDIGWIGGLTNIQHLSLGRNLLRDIGALTNIPYLANVDVRWNKLDLSDNSPAVEAIQGLMDRNPPVRVEVAPQWAPPRFDVRTNWFVNADHPSILFFEIHDEFTFTDLLPPQSVASDTNLLQDLLVTTNAYPYWTLSVTPSGIQGNGKANVTLTVTNGGGLTGTSQIAVTVTGYLPVPESAASGNLLATANWLTSEDTAPWFGQTNVTHDGVAAVMSGAVGNRTGSWVETAADGPGRLSFWWKVSSEANTDDETGSNPNDRLEFHLNGVRSDWISGEVGWNYRSFDVGPGSQRFRWSYMRDNDTSVGYDAGWLDEVWFFPVKLHFTIKPGAGQVQLGVYGVPGKRYAIESSANLVNWAQLGVVAGSERAQPFIDVAAGPGPRFYRLRDVSIWLEQPHRPVDGSVQLVLHSPPGLDFVIEASTNLAMWSEVARVTNTPGRAQYSDELIADSPRRFYRAMALP